MLLAQRQLRTGLIHSAVFTVMQLRDYEDVLNVEDIYCLLALASCADRSFGTCSKAFIKLESLESIPEQRRIEYEELAVNIFSQHEPEDMRDDRTECYICDASVRTWYSSCPNCRTQFPTCIASGRSIIRQIDAWQCTNCHHCTYTEEIMSRKSCPLCFGAISLKTSET